MRGSPSKPLQHKASRGIIPAHAGLTHLALCVRRLQWDHPRACGAHRVAKSGMAVLTGSSPRMRGSPIGLRNIAGFLGIIPAHAGLTCRPDSGDSGAWDHPRACGAHSASRFTKSIARGSSPRMRGSPIGLRNIAGFLGIIPAHAGLTCRPDSGDSGAWDHPRACGAHSASRFTKSIARGSSPRMRGSQDARHGQCLGDGIIPAHAGLTIRPDERPHRVRDHPRACGAHQMSPSQVPFR